MFDSGLNSQYVGSQKEKFVRLNDLESGLHFRVDALNRSRHALTTLARSFKHRFQKESERLKSIGRTLEFWVKEKIFYRIIYEILYPLKFWVVRKILCPLGFGVEEKVLNPQNGNLIMGNKFFLVSCILAVSVDPLFFYLPVFDQTKTCLGIDRKLAIIATTMRTVIDAFYLIHMALEFKTAYIAPSSRVFGRDEIVIHPGKIAKRYLRRYFIVDFLSVLPLPQFFIWRFLLRSRGSDVLATKEAFLFLVLIQYVPRLARIVPIALQLKRSAGVFAKTAWVGAAYCLLVYMIASHIVGAFWYLLSVERIDTCWRKACKTTKHDINFLYCGNEYMSGYNTWISNSTAILNEGCSPEGDKPPFDFGIFNQALSSGIVFSTKFVQKYCYCLWWGLQNLSTLGQGLQTSTSVGETIFSIALAISGLILFALLIAKMQTYLQSLLTTVDPRLEEMRVKSRDSEQWMSHWLLPEELRERVRYYNQYMWVETHGVDEANLVQTLPKDLRRDIRRHLCVALVTRVPLFACMDERMLDAICERLKPCLYTDGSYIVREGDPVDEMLFIIHGSLECVTTGSGSNGYYNRSVLREGDFYGDELLAYAIDPKFGVNLPSSTRTVKALSGIEAFALPADELKFVAIKFRLLHNLKLQSTFRYYSLQWRTWAVCFIQEAWHGYLERKMLKQRKKEEKEARNSTTSSGPSFSLGATLLASKFAANTLRGVQRNRNLRNTRELVKLEKPTEPEMTADTY